MMKQAKVSLNELQLEFLKAHKSFGYKDRSALVRAAIDAFRAQLEEQLLRESAELYAELYNSDPEHQQITASALVGWPE